MSFVRHLLIVFSFVLFSFAIQNHVLDVSLANPLIASVAVTMALTPLLMLFNEKLLRNALLAVAVAICASSTSAFAEKVLRVVPHADLRNIDPAGVGNARTVIAGYIRIDRQYRIGAAQQIRTSRIAKARAAP